MPRSALRTFAVAACLAFGGASAPASGQEAGAAPLAPPPSVTVETAAMGAVVNRVPISGTLVPRNEVLVYPQVSGYTIETLRVEVGDTVRAGDVLAELNSQTLRAQLAQAEAEHSRAEAAVRQATSQISSARASQEQADTTLDRSEALQGSGNISQAALDQARAAALTARAALASANDGLAVTNAQLAQAAAQRDIARLNLDHATITAPTDGLIAARNGQVGAIANSAGEPIFRLIRDGVIEAEAEVIETALGQIKTGDTAELDIAGVGRIAGKVRLIGATVDAQTRLGLVRIAIDQNPGLRSGLFAGGWIIIDQHEGLTVPASAVLTDANGTFVMRVENGTVEKRAVVAGLIWETRRELLSGLTLGDTVVARAGAFFADGDKVTPVAAPAGASQ